MTPEQRLARLRANEDPALIARLPSGFAVMAEFQYLPGYCLLLADPQIGKLNDLVSQERLQFLSDMAVLGDAVLAATGAVRINYAIYGNLDPFLHAHVWPRFSDEPDERRTLPPLTFPADFRTQAAARFNPQVHAELLEKIRRNLNLG